MIVIYKNRQCTYSVRPAFIGFIKNNIIRRVLCSLFFPVVLASAIIINLLQAIIVSSALLIRAVIYPISILKPIWKEDILHNPRTKGSE